MDPIKIQGKESHEHYFFLKPKSNIAYIYDHYTLRQALEKMKYYGYSAIPMIDAEGKYAGTVSEGDLLWAIMERSAFEKTPRKAVS